MTRFTDALPAPTSIFAVVLSCCFAIGGVNHGWDLIQGGLLPYRTVPLTINAFWSALCPVDFLLAALIWYRRRTAINLGVLVLLLDVAVNSWIAYFSKLHVSSFEPLQVQSLFFGFVLAGALFSQSERQRSAPRELDRGVGGASLR